jgi:hypothetical protein
LYSDAALCAEASAKAEERMTGMSEKFREIGGEFILLRASKYLVHYDPIPPKWRNYSFQISNQKDTISDCRLNYFYQ